MGPVASAFEVLGAQFTAGTMSAQIELMMSLLNLFQSEAGQAALTLAVDVISGLINGIAKMVEFTTDATNAIDEFSDALADAALAAREALALERNAIFNPDYVDVTTTTPGFQEFG